MREASLPIIREQLSALTERDFVAIRSSWDADPFAFVDERRSKPDVSPDIERFRAELEQAYLPFYADMFRRFLSLDLDFFVLDGSSAIPHGFILKSAYRRYKAAHEEEQLQPPTFLFLDAHPLSRTFHYTRLGNITDEDLSRMYGKKGYRALCRSMDRIRAHPNPKVLIYDESSELFEGGSPLLVSELVQRKVPHATVTVDSAFADYFTQDVTVDSATVAPAYLGGPYHVYRPLVRKTTRKQEAEKVNLSSFRRPSPLRHPLAHQGTRDLIQDCQRFGEFVAQVV